MNRVVKIIGAIFLLMFMLIILTGCGNNSPIVATREVDIDELRFTEVLEATFSGGRVYTVTSIFEFESEAEAREYYGRMLMVPSLDVIHSGRTVEVNMEVEDLIEQGLEGQTRDEYIQLLEEQGFAIRGR